MLIWEGKRTKKMNLEKLNQMLKKTDGQGCELPQLKKLLQIKICFVL
jgi:hypothetical protein